MLRQVQKKNAKLQRHMTELCRALCDEYVRHSSRRLSPTKRPKRVTRKPVVIHFAKAGCVHLVEGKKKKKKVAQKNKKEDEEDSGNETSVEDEK